MAFQSLQDCFNMLIKWELTVIKEIFSTFRKITIGGFVPEGRGGGGVENHLIKKFWRKSKCTFYIGGMHFVNYYIKPSIIILGKVC